MMKNEKQEQKTAPVRKYPERGGISNIIFYTGKKCASTAAQTA